jgi:hypothetical protein
MTDVTKGKHRQKVDLMAHLRDLRYTDVVVAPSGEAATGKTLRKQHHIPMVRHDTTLVLGNGQLSRHSISELAVAHENRSGPC